MKLLLVTHYWRPHCGGIETMTWEQARRLAKRGHRVSVVTSRLPGDPRFSRDHGIDIHRVTALNTFEKLGIPYPLFSLQLLPLLSRLVPEHDAVLVYNHSYLSSVAGALIARLRGRPMVLFQASPYIHYKFPWNVVERVADSTLGSSTLRLADKLVAISEHTADHVKSLLPGRPVEVLYLGADTSCFTPVASSVEQTQIRAHLGLPSEAFIVSTVRRLVHRNGVGTLLAAANRLKHHGDIYIVIIGTGPERAAIEKYIESRQLHNVRLMGFVADKQLPDFYRASDAFVLPTRSGEGFGLVLLEAFACGVPVISTRSGAPVEVVDHGRTGLLIPPESPAEMAAAILNLRSHPETLARMKQAARARAVEMDWEICVDGVEDVLAQLTNGKHPVPGVGQGYRIGGH